MLPRAFWNLWPIILIVVGLGGLLTSDSEEWMSSESAPKKAVKKSAPKAKKTVKKTTKKASKKK